MVQDQFKRNLTTILSAGVAGYSRLMQDDEVATVKILEQHKAIMSDFIHRHHGQLVQSSPGDSLLNMSLLRRMQFFKEVEKC